MNKSQSYSPLKSGATEVAADTQSEQEYKQALAKARFKGDYLEKDGIALMILGVLFLLPFAVVIAVLNLNFVGIPIFVGTTLFIAGTEAFLCPCSTPFP